MKNLHSINMLDEYDQAIQWYVDYTNKKNGASSFYIESRLKFHTINGQLYFTDKYDREPKLARGRWGDLVIDMFREHNEKST